MNKVTLVGYISQDPKATIISNGNERSMFNIAVKDAKNYQETYFIPCVAWKPISVFVNNNIKKGDLVCVDGRLVRRSYIGNDGKNNYITEVVVDNFSTLLKKTFGTSEINTTLGDMENHNNDNKNNIDESYVNNENHVNLDDVFSSKNHVDSNNDDSSNDDVDWDSEFN